MFPPPSQIWTDHEFISTLRANEGPLRTRHKTAKERKTNSVYRNHFDILLPPSQFELDYRIWKLGMDVKRNTSWLNRNNHTRNNLWNQPTHEPNPEEPTQITNYITPFTDCKKCTSQCETSGKTRFTMKNSLYQFQYCAVKWNSKTGIERTPLHASRICHVYWRTYIKGMLKLNKIFTSQ